QSLSSAWSNPLDDHNALIDKSTELSLHLPIVSVDGHGDQRQIKTLLHRFAFVGTASAGIDQALPRTFRPGIGLAGQAFRGRHSILFNKQGDAGSEFYVR